MGNMYGDSILQINAVVGCKFHCKYCSASFQRQMKRQKQNCMKCYNYEVHAHLDRLNRTYPQTEGDQFIWLCSSSDISFAKEEWLIEVFKTIENNPQITFFLQSKDPRIFLDSSLPKNLIIGTTLETNLNDLYITHNISEAPVPKVRAELFKQIDHPRKSVTIEPILKFELTGFVKLLKAIAPERIYIGYDTKNCGLPEPSLLDTKFLIHTLKQVLPRTIIKMKYIPQDYKLDKWMEAIEKE